MRKKQTIQVGAILAGMALLILGALSQTLSFGQEYYVLTVNKQEVGAVSESTDIEGLIRQARIQVMQQTQGYAYVDAGIRTEKSSKKFQKLLGEKEMLQALTEAISGQMLTEKTQAYTIACGNYSANFSSQTQAVDFLDQVKNHTPGGTAFEISIEEASGAKDARKAVIVNPNEEQKKTYPFAGVVSHLADTYASAQKMHGKEYQNRTGILDMQFADNVYAYENFVDADSLADIPTELAEVTKEKETNTIYVVEAGDCLSIIAEKFDTTMDSIVALNELKSEEATVYLDQELIVAIPRPDITLQVSEGIVYEEEYTAEPTIISNEGWYTTQELVHQEGITGKREINALVTTENGIEVARENLHTLVLEEAVPAVVEQGTQIPPTYIRPMSGGRFTSGYGKRWGRIHKGVDWAVSVGTPVYASSAGTVSVAGAVRGYGYAVYINHPDGRQTRYGHLSKVLVSPGETVEQGQRIALSGNTGRSTGPHLHFEILIDGSQVNPLNYMQ